MTYDELHRHIRALGTAAAFHWLRSGGLPYLGMARRLAVAVEGIRFGMEPGTAWDLAHRAHPEADDACLVPDPDELFGSRVALAADCRNGTLDDTTMTLQAGGDSVSLNSVPVVVISDAIAFTERTRGDGSDKGRSVEWMHEQHPALLCPRGGGRAQERLVAYRRRDPDLGRER